MIVGKDIIKAWGDLILDSNMGDEEAMKKLFTDLGFDPDGCYRVASAIANSPRLFPEDEGFAFITGLLLGGRLVLAQLGEVVQ